MSMTVPSIRVRPWGPCRLEIRSSVQWRGPVLFYLTAFRVNDPAIVDDAVPQRPPFARIGIEPFHALPHNFFFFLGVPVQAQKGGVAIDDVAVERADVNAGQVAFEQNLKLFGCAVGPLRLIFKQRQNHAEGDEILRQPQERILDGRVRVAGIKNVLQRKSHSPGEQRNRGGDHSRGDPAKLAVIQQRGHYEEYAQQKHPPGFNAAQRGFSEHPGGVQGHRNKHTVEKEAPAVMTLRQNDDRGQADGQQQRKDHPGARGPHLQREIQKHRESHQAQEGGLHSACAEYFGDREVKAHSGHSQHGGLEKNRPVRRKQRIAPEQSRGEVDEYRDPAEHPPGYALLRVARINPGKQRYQNAHD